MNMRWRVVLSVVAALGLVALPALAQPSMAPGAGHMGGARQSAGQPLSIAQAETIVRQALARSGYQGLAPGHIMEFSNNFYVAVTYKVGGQGALELLVDRYTGVVHPEPQSMMWNTQFGHMRGGGGPGDGLMGGAMTPGGAGGMMGPGGHGGGSACPGGPSMMGGGMGPGGMGPGMMGPTPVTAGSPSVTTARARRLAQQFLDARLPGARLEEDTMTFPGYYTLDFTRNGRIAGMVSVNAYTGQVWYHAWHGTFIQEKDLG